MYRSIIRVLSWPSIIIDSYYRVLSFILWNVPKSSQTSCFPINSRLMPIKTEIKSVIFFKFCFWEKFLRFFMGSRFFAIPTVQCRSKKRQFFQYCTYPEATKNHVSRNFSFFLWEKNIVFVNVKSSTLNGFFTTKTQ